ncbi:MAG: S24 family peptidase [Phycisphaerae bacterium]
MSRVPPADVLVRIGELTGADLRWLLTGRESADAAAPFDHPTLRRAATLLADRPDAAAPLAAFLDILIEAGKFPAKTGRSRAAGEERTGLAEGPAKRQAVAEVAPRPAEEAAQAGEAARAGWIPILGRSAAGVPHFWADGDEAAGLTTLEELVSRHSAATSNVRPATATGPDGSEESPVQVITLSVPDTSEVVQFVAAPQIKARWPDAFALRIDGDSMAPDIRHGDLAIVSPSAAAADGRAAIVQLEGQIGVNCKLFRRGQDVIHLVPVNDRYEIATFPADQLVWALRVLARVRS